LRSAFILKAKVNPLARLQFGWPSGKSASAHAKIEASVDYEAIYSLLARHFEK